MNCDERRTLSFLAGELGDEERAAFDRHLLQCEPCWSAVTEDRRGRALAESLREPAPAGLADRIRLAADTAPPAAGQGLGTGTGTGTGVVAVAAGATISGRGRPWLRSRLAVAAAVLVTGGAVGAGTTLALTSGSSGSSGSPPSMAVTMTAVHLGHALPMHLEGPSAGVPTTLGPSVAMTVAGVDLSVTYYHVGGGEALLVESRRPFAMPSGGRTGHHAGSWTAQLEGLTMWCTNGPMSAAIVTPMPSAATDLAQYLGMSV